MNAGIGESRRTIAIAAGLVATICLLLAMPAISASKPPAVDEYTLNFPHPGGENDSGPEAGKGASSGGDPAALTPATRDQLADPNDAALVAIATDPALGAIDSAKGESTASSRSEKGGGSSAGFADQRGVLAAATSALTGGSLPLLGLGLLATAIATFVARRRASDR